MAAPESTFWTIADTATKIAFAVIGAIWTWLMYVRGRTFRRRLEPKITGKIFEDGGSRFLSIDAAVKNVGLSRAVVLQKGTWVRIVRLQRKSGTTSVAVPKEVHIGTPEIFKKHAWVEPEEEVHDVLLVQLPAETADDIAIGLTLRVVSHEWRWPTPFAPPQEGEQETSLEPEQLFRRNLAWNAGSIVPLRVQIPQEQGTEIQTSGAHV